MALLDRVQHPRLWLHRLIFLLILDPLAATLPSKPGLLDLNLGAASTDDSNRPQPNGYFPLFGCFPAVDHGLHPRQHYEVAIAPPSRTSSTSAGELVWLPAIVKLQTPPPPLRLGPLLELDVPPATSNVLPPLTHRSFRDPSLIQSGLASHIHHHQPRRHAYSEQLRSFSRVPKSTPRWQR